MDSLPDAAKWLPKSKAGTHQNFKNSRMGAGANRDEDVQKTLQNHLGLPIF